MAPTISEEQGELRKRFSISTIGSYDWKAICRARLIPKAHLDVSKKTLLDSIESLRLGTSAVKLDFYRVTGEIGKGFDIHYKVEK